MTTTLFQLRALELGIKKTDLKDYTSGQIFALLTEKGNDRYEWPLEATQEQINKLFPQGGNIKHGKQRNQRNHPSN